MATQLDQQDQGDEAGSGGLSLCLYPKASEWGPAAAIVFAALANFLCQSHRKMPDLDGAQIKPRPVSSGIPWEMKA